VSLLRIVRPSGSLGNLFASNPVGEGAKSCLGRHGPPAYTKREISSAQGFAAERNPKTPFWPQNLELPFRVASRKPLISLRLDFAHFAIWYVFKDL